VIFQDPYSSLNPRKPIGDSILAGLKIHMIGNGKDQVDEISNSLEKVGPDHWVACFYVRATWQKFSKDPSVDSLKLQRL
jgi:ABC-type microcin C transport system duplicated ATPase subunit YejF